MTPVVAGKNDQGIFSQLMPVQHFKHLSHHLIGPLHFGQVIGHIGNTGRSTGPNGALNTATNSTITETYSYHNDNNYHFD